MLKPSDLLFDRKNPRFVEGAFDSESDIIGHLIEEADVKELVQSILSAGYVDFEPLIVEQRTNVVLEGNRRLAALRLIADPELRKQLRFELPDTEEPREPPEKVRVRLVANRSAARSYIGFKHINGPFKWDAMAKARYAAEWLDEGANIDTVSRTLGDGHSTVRRLVVG